jgi:hypothetical protein
MLAVMDFHRLRVDVWSEGVESVGQGREGEGHGCDLFIFLMERERGMRAETNASAGQGVNFAM